MYEGGDATSEWKAANKSSKQMNDDGLSRKDIVDANAAVDNVKEVVDGHKPVSNIA